MSKTKKMLKAAQKFKSKDRIKQNGEVFTPQKLVREMLSKFSKDSFTISNKTFLDPACGDGNFLVEIAKKRIRNGIHPMMVAATTFGVELMQDNVDKCRNRLFRIYTATADGKLYSKFIKALLKCTIVCADTLKFYDDDEPIAKHLAFSKSKAFRTAWLSMLAFDGNSTNLVMPQLMDDWEE